MTTSLETKTKEIIPGCSGIPIPLAVGNLQFPAVFARLPRKHLQGTTVMAGAEPKEHESLGTAGACLLPPDNPNP